MQTNRRPISRTVHSDDNTPVMAYVPIQVLTSVYEPYQGFCVGTIFPDLNKPFKWGGVMG